MNPDVRVSTAGTLYVSSVIVAGTLLLLQSLYGIYIEPVDYRWTILACLTLISGSLTVKVPGVPSSISVSEIFIIISVLLFGPAPATIIVALECLVISLWLLKNTPQVYRVFFNMACGAISIWLPSKLLFALSGTRPLSEELVPISQLLLPLAAFTTAFFLLNSWLVTFAVAVETRKPPFQIWRDNYAWLSVNYFGGASIAALLLPYTQEVNLSALAILLPLLLISYLISRVSMGRVEDARRHIQELNALYISTIETLAMAIDAKDQITHGHIRRVQVYAVRLASELGIRDEAEIKAIEAASLLHDMGKLAVPEYILNKPGPLTAAEFEKMKLHATVGADILSAIDFPYPVVPVVRHHHENWDGSGYPAALKGSEIPLGARILAVVDCFDALTSDRPYRPRLADADAVKILLERRGTMYDPKVVDTFLRIYEQIPTREFRPSEQRSALAAITEAAQPFAPAASPSQPLDDISASTEEMLTLYDLAQGLTGQMSLADAGDIIAKHVRRIVPASLCVFYVYDGERDELVAGHAAGEGGDLCSGLRIPLGQRLSGWVGANRQTILNSDPVLDLGEVARALDPRPRSCLSTALIADNRLVGVLTLYSTRKDAFTEDHKRILEVVGRQVSRTVRESLNYERVRASALRDDLTGLPNIQRLRMLFASELEPDGSARGSLSILLVDVISVRHISASREPSDNVLATVVQALRRVLRGADILSRYGSHEFVILLSQTDAQTATRLGERIRSALTSEGEGRTEPEAGIQVSVGIATAPQDGSSLEALVSIARSRSLRPSGPNHITGQKSDSVH